ncbi:MAG: hypothetical protein AAGE65_13355 [Planctomycetota bacterium]
MSLLQAAADLFVIRKRLTVLQMKFLPLGLFQGSAQIHVGKKERVEDRLIERYLRDRGLPTVVGTLIDARPQHP